MTFLSNKPDFPVAKPLFCSILGNTLISTIPGISGAGPSPEKTLYTPILDAELIVRGDIRSMPIRPNTPTGCPTPASITRSMMVLTGLVPVFINAGLMHSPTVPCIDVYGAVGEDPRFTDAVPHAAELVERGKYLGGLFSTLCDTLVLGECVPGGTTTALCVLRALGFQANVSSSYIENPVSLKEEISRTVLERIKSKNCTTPLEIMQCCGDPMMPVATGICLGYKGNLVLAGGTQMLAVAGLLKNMGEFPPRVITTEYVRADKSANIEALARKTGVEISFVNPEFGDLGHSGLARYCIGEVKEGMGAGGSMALAYMLGHRQDEIKNHIFETVSRYC